MSTTLDEQRGGGIVAELAENLTETLEGNALKSLPWEDRKDMWKEWTKELKSAEKKYQTQSSGSNVTFREVFLQSNVLEKVISSAFQNTTSPPKDEFTDLLAGCLCTGEGKYTDVLVDQLWSLIPLTGGMNHPDADPDKRIALQRLVDVLVECFTLFKAVPTDLSRAKQLANEQSSWQVEPSISVSSETDLRDLLKMSQSRRTFIADVLSKTMLQSSHVKYSKKVLLQKVQHLQEFIENKLKNIASDHDDIYKEEKTQLQLFKSGMTVSELELYSLEAECTTIEQKRAELTAELESLRQSELTAKSKIKEITTLRKELQGAHSRVSNEIRNHSKISKQLETDYGKESDSIKKVCQNVTQFKIKHFYFFKKQQQQQQQQQQQFSIFVSGSHKLASEFAKKCLDKKVEATRDAYCHFLKSAQPRLKICYQEVSNLRNEAEKQSKSIQQCDSDEKDIHVESLTQTVSQATELVMSATRVEREIRTWEKELSVSGKLKDIDIGETPNCIFSSLEGIDKLNKNIIDLSKNWVPVRKTKSTKPRRSHRSSNSDFPTAMSDISLTNTRSYSSFSDITRCDSSMPTV